MTSRRLIPFRLGLDDLGDCLGADGDGPVITGKLHAHFSIVVEENDLAANENVVVDFRLLDHHPILTGTSYHA